MKRFHNIYLALGLAGVLTGVTGCSDDFQTPDTNPEGITGVTLYLPNIEGAAEFGRTRGEDATRANEAAAEGKLQEVWLYAFADDPNNNVAQPLALNNMTVVSNAYRSVSITLTPDNYRFYVLGNISKYKEGGALSEATTEEQIRAIKLNFDATGNQLSLANGLPMACLDTEIKVGGDGATSGVPVGADGKVEVGAGECPVIFADMKFLCSKVRYTVLHDRNSFSSAFGQAEFDLADGKISNIVNVTKWQGAAVADYTDKFDLSFGTPVEKNYPSDDDIASFNSKEFNLTDLTGTKDLKGAKRAWQQTVYLPENLATASADKSKLTITTKTNGVDSSYELVLNEKSNQSKILERGRVYDIMIKAASRDVFDLSNITVSNWEPEDIVADFTHTYLTLSQSEGIEVKSLEPFELGYQTDGTGGLTGFTCKQQWDNAALITYKRDGENKITLQINPNINVAKVPQDERTGVAEVELRAGNIKKTLNVKYDMSPVFIVNPTERTIQYGSTADNQTEFYFLTNLGGVKIKRLDAANYPVSYPQVSTQGSGEYESKLEYRFAGGSNVVPEDYIVMTETKDGGPKTSSVHNFMIEPIEIPDGEPAEDYQKVLTVTVQPPLGGYRIYFRPINDYYKTNNGANSTGTQNEYLATKGFKMPSENEPWLDFWDEDGNNSKNEDKHRVYIYNQSNNNSTWNDLGHNVVMFTNWCDDYNKMTGDDNNAGWYYRDLPTSECKNYDGQATWDFQNKEEFKKFRYPMPGQTLMIFHNALWTDTGGGSAGFKGEYMAHRVASSNDPGVPLFSFADREGWYIYDPTRDPVFNCYDDKPVIEDVEYVIYSTSQLTGWYRTYGRWRDVENYRITIYANDWKGINGGVTPDKNKQETINGTTYYVNRLWFKAPRGEYDKAIILKFQNGKESMLFDGGIFENNTGCFDGTSWSEGAPN